ncbi:MAG: helix-turn-helix transcriptional regulator [Kiloniellales bacterium]|nr:helix-turn-helix transcriptional regulator [Kiloniellales bacterium]
MLKLNARTLQRRLSHASTSYSRIVDELRFEKACCLLEGGDRSIAEIARALGYSDPAHFTRAFRRWAGMTPREYRQRGKSARGVKRRRRLS